MKILRMYTIITLNSRLVNLNKDLIHSLVFLDLKRTPVIIFRLLDHRLKVVLDREIILLKILLLYLCME
jgi:hypothetical protein